MTGIHREALEIQWRHAVLVEDRRDIAPRTTEHSKAFHVSIGKKVAQLLLEVGHALSGKRKEAVFVCVTVSPNEEKN